MFNCIPTIVFVIGCLLLNNSCSRKRCEGDGYINQHELTAENWQWFNFPEGTRIAYENNLGEKDTAVFGPIVVTNERGYHDSKNCNTIYTRKMTQDITWINELKGRIRPIKLIAGGGNFGNHLEYTKIGETYLDIKLYTDTLTFKKAKLNDVFISDCNSSNYIYKCLVQSKSKFHIGFSYQISKDSTETWIQK